MKQLSFCNFLFRPLYREHFNTSGKPIHSVLCLVVHISLKDAIMIVSLCGFRSALYWQHVLSSMSTFPNQTLCWFPSTCPSRASVATPVTCVASFLNVHAVPYVGWDGPGRWCARIPQTFEIPPSCLR